MPYYYRPDSWYITMPDREQKPSQTLPPKRGLLLRVLYRVYTNYLGVTPPTPQQERVVAVVLISAVIAFLIGGVLLLRFLWQTMANAGGAR